MSRVQRKPPASRKQVLLRRCYIALTIVAAVIVAAFLAWKLLVVKPTVPTSPVPPPVADVDGTGDVPTPKVHTEGRKEDFYTFLVVGRDTGGGGNTDTILLAGYDAKHQGLTVMSIPRDTMVNVSWDIKRINSVYNVYGGGDKGIQALDDELAQLVGFRPDFQVVIEWDAVGELVDAIGGVWFDVPRNMDYDDPTQDLHIHLKAGYQKLDGEQAMGVVRYRHDNRKNGKMPGYPNGDLGRIETQQAFLKATLEQCLKLKNIPSMAQVFFDNVTTNMTVSDMVWFAQSAVLGGLDADSVNFVTMPCTNRSVWSRSYPNDPQSYVTPNAKELLDIVNAGLNPYADDVEAGELDLMYVNSDGTIGSTTGVVEDTKHNAAWRAFQAAAQAPAETAPPATEPPGPGGEEPPAESAVPTPEETAAPPEPETPAEPPVPTPEATPTPTPEPTPDPNAPPEGIPIA